MISIHITGTENICCQPYIMLMMHGHGFQHRDWVTFEAFQDFRDACWCHCFKTSKAQTLWQLMSHPLGSWGHRQVCCGLPDARFPRRPPNPTDARNGQNCRWGGGGGQGWQNKRKAKQHQHHKRNHGNVINSSSLMLHVEHLKSTVGRDYKHRTKPSMVV